MKALIVDDSEMTLKVAQAILLKMGFIVVTAMNGLDAIKLFKVTPFDLVVTDYQMPEIDGVEVTLAFRKIERQQARKACFLVATSAAGSDEVARLFLQAQADRFEHKPLTLKKMKLILGDVFKLAA